MQRATRYKLIERNAMGLSRHSDVPSSGPAAKSHQQQKPKHHPQPGPQAQKNSSSSCARRHRARETPSATSSGLAGGISLKTGCSREGPGSWAQEGQDCGARPRLSFPPVPSPRDHRASRPAPTGHSRARRSVSRPVSSSSSSPAF